MRLTKQRLRKIQHDDDEGLLDYNNNRQVQEVTLLKNIIVKILDAELSHGNPSHLYIERDIMALFKEFFSHTDNKHWKKEGHKKWKDDISEWLEIGYYNSPNDYLKNYDNI